MSNPLVSILIPCFNAENSIINCLNSCKNQTYKNIEILVLNDGSTDESKFKINSFDCAIQYLEFKDNKGIAASRNELLKNAKGQYIAWLDADDEMLPNRIEQQVMYLEQHQDIDICGSWMLDKNNPKNLIKTFKHPDFIKSYLWFKNCMFQPSVMSKNFYVHEQVFYNSEFDYLEDYDLWYRLLKTKKFANLNQALTVYQLPNQTLTNKHKQYDFEAKMTNLWTRKWQELNLIASETQKSLFVKFIYKNWNISSSEIKDLLWIFNQIQTQNKNQYVKEIIGFYQLRLFKNISFFNQLKHLFLLKGLVGIKIYLMKY